MSTIKSSAENLTLNADGSGNDVLIQSNGSTKAIVTAEGTLGIGTTAPLRQLHISNTSANPEIAFTSGTSGAASLLFGDGLTGTDVYKGYVQYQHNGDYMLIATGATTRLRVDSDGLKFNADTAAANALNDYETGSFTPAASGGAGSTSGSYTKIGRLVTCHGTLTFPSQSNSGHATVEGLPFTSVNADGFSGFIRYTDYNPKQIMIHGNPNSTTFGLYEVDYGSDVTQVSWTEISGKRFDFTVVYFAA